jgi:hypothetical protein
MQVYQIAKGARFEFRGKQFEKIAMSMAVDTEGCGNVFWAGTEITPLGEPLLLPPGRGREVETSRHALDFHYYTSPGAILNAPVKMSDLGFEPQMIATLPLTLASP